MSQQKKIEDFYTRAPINRSENTKVPIENPQNHPTAVKTHPNYSRDVMEIDDDTPNPTQNSSVSRNYNSDHNPIQTSSPSSYSTSNSYSSLRLPHHTRALWASRKPALYSIASKHNCTVENILQVVYHNIVECRIIKSDQLDINVFIHYLNDNESAATLDLFAKIASYALEVELLFPQPIPILTRHRPSESTLSAQQIRCLLALMFYCLFPKQEQKFDLPKNYTFAKVFSDPGTNVSSKVSKIRCVLNYFKRQERFERLNLTFSRQVLQKRIDWTELQVQLSPVELIEAKNCTEDYRERLMIDFANHYVGGGSLGSGCVQEEIMFFKHIEPLVSLLFTEKLEDGESLLIKGSQRFNKTSGYKSTFAFEEDFVENIFPDEQNRNNSFLVAIDALDYTHNPFDQFSARSIQRDLEKAYIGFYIEDPRVNQVITGRWGCGAFGGDDELKFILQWLAASATQKEIGYLLWESSQSSNIRFLVEALQSKVRVCDLYRTLEGLKRNESVILQVIKKLTRLF